MTATNMRSNLFKFRHFERHYQLLVGERSEPSLEMWVENFVLPRLSIGGAYKMTFNVEGERKLS